MSGIEEIELRHKKERKELQSKIQSLKKIIKGDKNKKKEITQQITNLEFELDNRHKLELQHINDQSNTDEIFKESVQIETSENETVPKSKSKAQKRREKKEQEEKERNERIKAQDKVNLLGPRITEEKSITDKLVSRQLSVFTIPSDGDCLYKAVSHQLDITGRDCLSVKELRIKTAKYIHENKDDFLPFMSHPETCDMLTDEEFEKYCNDIADTSVWGGQLEIRALSNVLKCPIEIIQATGPESIELGSEYDGVPLVLTYHRHMFKLGEHYNSTQAFIEECNDEIADTI